MHTGISKILTGVPELDTVLRGGLPKHRVHLIEGKPGTGKTTLALQFLLEGQKQAAHRALYITMSESEEELRSAAASHGWDLGCIEIYDLVPNEAKPDHQQTVLYPAEAELSDTISRIASKITESSPDRLVIDSASDLRLLASEPSIYRRQILELKQFLQGRRCTTLLLDDKTGPSERRDLHSVVHGVLSLEQSERTFGEARRRLRIIKMRGSDYQSGWHDFVITPKAILVFPSLIADEHEDGYQGKPLLSELPELNALLGGGIDRGTVTMFIGPSGVGKTTLALQYAMSAVSQGEHVAYFSFDETYSTVERRAAALRLNLKSAVSNQQVTWERANPSRLSPGEFMWQVRRRVEDHAARLIIIDSLNSYLATMPEESALVLQMHELLTYLNNKGCMTILILAQQGLVSEVANPIDLSFLSDTVILLRFFEAQGQVRKAISMVKRRTGMHEGTIREFELSKDGIHVGPPLAQFDGVLSGIPTYRGDALPSRSASSSDDS